MFRRLPSGLAAATGALLTSQIPAFHDQYVQSLGGRLDQARLHAGRIAEAARNSGLDLAGYLARLAENADPVARTQAEVAAAALADVERLSAAYAALTATGPGLGPLVLLRHLDAAVAGATAARFAPAAPLTGEGLVYAALGALAGFFVYWALRRLWAARRRILPPAGTEGETTRHV